MSILSWLTYDQNTMNKWQAQLYKAVCDGRISREVAEREIASLDHELRQSAKGCRVIAAIGTPIVIALTTLLMLTGGKMNNGTNTKGSSSHEPTAALVKTVPFNNGR